ncbi:AraC family transcriptional regulator [Duganella sp. FT3S]|uniref:AraC family transcriptional regulator n=1 Tax=Rugamonas fusca TaxID=2758568 RepID=A0A7W2EK02_9BURK|nr:AraC family transcriptional regulator [Rugamonas fusca]MBA5607316.1 AraC family transcriptional regulator [Rugamonas fusca]
MGCVRAAVLANYLNVAEQLGVDGAAQMLRVGLRPHIIDTPDALIPVDPVAKLIEETARISQCETVGLRMSQPRSMSAFGVVGLLLAHQRNLRDAWSMVHRYLSMINESVALRIEEEGDSALLVEEVLTGHAQPQRQSIELALASNLNLFRTLLGPNWAPRVVYLQHSAPRQLDDHQRIFRCRCVFDAEINGMRFARADLDAPNPMADPILGRYASSLIESIPAAARGSMTARVRRLIHLHMPIQRASIKAVAQSLGVSVHKLQMDLAAEHSEFSEMLNEARREQARQYLTSGRFDIGQIASLLGYTEPNSFTRWFSKQFGESPTKWRRRVA